MRTTFTIVHRWVGLVIAAFLFVAGLTGAIVSWDHELDEWLNPQFHKSTTRGVRQAPLDLVREVERRDPRARVTYVVMDPPIGESQQLFVTGRVDPSTGKQVDLPYNNLAIDPVTGDELGRRNLGAVWPLTRENIVSFIYRLHYSLHIPEMFGINRWGVWLMGGIAVLWLIDCFVGFYLTLPVRKARTAGRAPSVERQLGKGLWARWKPAWTIKTGGSAYRITFDIHRALSLWTWAILFMLAFTSFSLNLYREVFHPLMSMVSTVTPTPFDERKPRSRHDPIEPTLGYAEILARAEQDVARRGWSVPIGALGYSPIYGIYHARLFAPGDDHGTAGVGPARLYYDATDGRAIGERVAWVGTAADLFVQAQFPLHSGRILGLPGRILISIMGLLVATLSVTGVVIWWRKRRARVRKVVKASVPRQGRLIPAE